MNLFSFRRSISSIGLNNTSSREVWLENTLREIPKGKRVLDAGAGELRYKKFCNHLNYVSQDFGQYDGKGNASGLQTSSWDNTKLDIVCDIINIPEPDASFDVIMCIEVLEHLPEPILALKEFSRLLKPGGALIITAPFCSLTHFAPYHYSTGFSRYFYEKHLIGNGFEISELHANGNYFEYMAQETRRIASIAAKYSKPINRMDRTITRFMLKLLQKLSTTDSGSSELLCYGYNVKAFKK